MSADAWRAMQPRYGRERRRHSDSAATGSSARLEAATASPRRQGIEFDYVHATLQIDDWTFRDVAVRYKGNGSYLRATRAGSDKISLKVDLNKYVKGQKLAGLTTINFQNNITDVGWMNEVLAYRLYRDAGALAPRTTYAQVYLTVEGQREKRYLGLYSISENVDENFAEDRFGTKEGRDPQAVHAGAVHRLGPGLGGLQPVVRSQDRSDRRAEAARHRARPARVERDRMRSSRRRSATTWTSTTSPDTSPSSSGSPTTTACSRTARTSTPTSTPTPTGCTSSRGTRTSRSGTRGTTAAWSIYSAWTGSNRFLSRLYNVEAFRSKYLARMTEFSERLFVPERFMQQVGEIGPAIRPSVELEGEEWLAGFDRVVAGSSGIVPYVTSRAAFVKAELEKGEQTR